MAIKRDCFAWHNDGCIALSEILCNRRKCPFYKTNEQAESERKKCEQRLSKVAAGNADKLPPTIAGALASVGERPKQSYTYKRERDRGSYMSDRIARLKAEGKCPVCGLTTDRPGKWYCSACWERKKALEKARSEIIGD